MLMVFFLYSINVPLEDALIHMWQINSWRGMVDNLVERISPLDGKPRSVRFGKI